ncbi:MAG: hypothetical protein M3Q08_01230 [Pseudomonadota bacterium]|nr:hypothetical protein [Pseudomonadota bacterium]
MPLANYILTTFSPAMFGEGATAHIKIITPDVAKTLVGADTKIVATRVSHDRLARNQFPAAAPDTSRYAVLKPGTTAIHIHYRGPQVPESGELPVGGMITNYLIEVEDYQEAAE